MRAWSWVLAAVLVTIGAAARGAVLEVPATFSTIQAAIDAAVDGDEVRVAPGTYREDIDFGGKAIAVVGSGPASVLLGTGTGSVVTFASGEERDSVLDSFMVTGGNANMGGGIRIVGAGPTIRRNVIRENLAVQRGSGIYVEGATATPYIHNNLVVFNANSGGDPHAIQSNGASPLIENNSIVRNDSNGILVAGGGVPVIVNNLLVFNGSRQTGSESRGRGICDFSPDTVVRYNLFYRNRVAALLRGGVDYRRVHRAERMLTDPDLVGNLDGNPRFARRRPTRDPADATLVDFAFRDSRRASPAIGAGDPDPAYANIDGSRNTIGHTGGPFGVDFAE